MFDELTIGWAAFRKHLWGWLLLGGLGGVLAFATSALSRWAEDQFVPATAYAIGLLSNVGHFYYAAGLFAIAIGQLRNHKFELDRFFEFSSKWVSVGVASIASIVCYWLLAGIVPPVANLKTVLAYAVWPLLCIPFALSLPMLLESGKKPVHAVWEGFRWTLPRYHKIFLIEMAITFGVGIAMAPIMCVAQAASFPATAFGAVVGAGLLIVAGAAMQPIWTLAISALYLRYRNESDPLPVQSNHGGPTFDLPG